MSARHTDRLRPAPPPPRLTGRSVQPSYTLESAVPVGHAKVPVRPPKTRTPRRRLVVSPPGRSHPDAFSGGETLSSMAVDRRPSAFDTFQPAPLDGVGSPRWVSPQISSEAVPPPNAPVAPMPSFRSEEAVVREDSLATHWGCTVLVGSVKNSWQPVDHQMWGQKLHPRPDDPFSQNPIFKPAGDGGARSIPREMVWLHSGSYRYTGFENNLVRHLPEPPARYEHGGQDARPSLQLVGQQSMLTPRSATRGGVHGSSSSQSCVVLPKLLMSAGGGGGQTELELACIAEPADEAWIAAVLEMHNGARAAHGACPLVWSDDCFEMASKQAAQCATDDLLTHGHLEGRSGRHGQNIFLLQQPGGLPGPGPGDGQGGMNAREGEGALGGAVDCVGEAVGTWYEESEDYTWEEPGYAGNTGHFSQLVWGDTEMVGMAIATCRVRGGGGGGGGQQQRRRYIVANYYPAGNVYVPGEFERNVLPSNAENPHTETLLNAEFERLAHLTPRAIPPRREDTVEDYMPSQSQQHQQPHQQEQEQEQEQLEQEQQPPPPPPQ
jgi:hypothetical protein